jgi:hypothetical protein
LERHDHDDRDERQDQRILREPLTLVSPEQVAEEVRGLDAYFALAETPSVFAEFDESLRRRLRQVRWKEWKGYAARRRNLRTLGIADRQARQWAASRRGYWRLSGSPVLARALPNRYWAYLGLMSLHDRAANLREHWRTAGCGPARPVVWEGSG